jgi:hypothetical protein
MESPTFSVDSGFLTFLSISSGCMSVSGERRSAYLMVDEVPQQGEEMYLWPWWSFYMVVFSFPTGS